MKKSVLIISYVPNYNRQGYDLAECLRSLGYCVRLFQMNGCSDEEKGIVGIRCIKPNGFLHKIHMLRNMLVFLLRTLFVKKGIVICIGKPMLMLGGCYQKFFGSKLVWYSLEYSKLGIIDRYVYQKCVSGYIDVEENRRDAIFSEYGEKVNSIICYNTPHLHKTSIEGGRLRKYLENVYGLIGNEQLIIYAGSFQRYACLDNIIEASKAFPKNRKLILMVYGLPDELKAASQNCLVVPPVQGEEFYEWLADADCALLPYESDSDFNVKNCSPQKLFDYYCVGVPYVASNRPLIRKVLQRYGDAGAMCNFKDVSDIIKQIDYILLKGRLGRAKMKALHVTDFNYDKMNVIMSRFVELLNA